MKKRVAIIGAGLSGAVCYKALNGLVDKVQVFEKNAKTGGRLRLNNDINSTLGFTVSTPFFQNIVERWIEMGWFKHRDGWDVEISRNEVNNTSKGQTQFEAAQGMLNFVDELFDADHVMTHTTIQELDRVNNDWRLFDKDANYLGAYDCVVLTQANETSQALVNASDLLSKTINTVEYSSVWTVVLQFKHAIDFPYTSATFDEGGLATVYKIPSDDGDKYYLQATPEWSENYKNKPQQDIIKMMSLSLFKALQLAPVEIAQADAQFWANKAPIQAYGEDCVFDDQLGLGICGDWCVAPRVEGAVLSGFSVADRVMKFLS